MSDLNALIARAIMDPGAILKSVRPDGESLSSWQSRAVLQALTEAKYAIVPGWRTMEGAPKDGTLIMYRFDGHVAGECWWDGEAWWDSAADQMAHPEQWAPLLTTGLRP